MTLQNVAVQPAIPKWDGCEDRTLYWTVSLHIDRNRLPRKFHEAFDPKNKVAVQNKYQQSAELRDAMEPLFNDIADRERLSEVGDYLLDVPGERQGEWVEIAVPPEIKWNTEGMDFSADLGARQVRLLRCRRFWYVHMDGSLSYHVSFTLKYEHTPADYYFMSLLQKVLAPKEFKLDPPVPTADEAPATSPATHAVHVTDARAGLFPLDKVLVHGFDPASGQWEPLAPFWHYLRARFDQHAKDLFKAFSIPITDSAGKPAQSPFDALIATDPFIEVPGLHVPRARFVFLFDDEALFYDLLPRPDAHGRRVSRRQLVTSDNFREFKEWFRDERARVEKTDKRIVVLTRDNLASVEPVKLRYLFVSGFIQNIIDFMNQDASEILDSTDPVYPETQEQEEESFFVRYASPRSITQFVPGSRSLECGNDYIGTCPYVFLVHLLAMHNEFLVRDYERQTDELTRDVQALSEKGHLNSAADRFYRFRTGEYTTYQKNKYSNVFRYDTERDLFRAVEKRRGTHRKDKQLNAIVNNLEAQTRDLEVRLRSKVDRQLSWLLGAVGIFSVLQVLYQVLDVSTRGVNYVSHRPIDGLDFSAGGLAETASGGLFIVTVSSLLLIIVFAMLMLLRLAIRR